MYNTRIGRDLGMQIVIRSRSHLTLHDGFLPFHQRIRALQAASSLPMKPSACQSSCSSRTS